MKIRVLDLTKRATAWEPIYASLEITTGFLWWRETTRAWIRQAHIGMRWRFSDNNELVPEDAINSAMREWEASKFREPSNRPHP